MTDQTIDILPMLQSGDFTALDELEVREGDLIELQAETGELWLPQIFQNNPMDEAHAWSDEIRHQLARHGLQMVTIDVRGGYRGDRHVYTTELQVAFVGDLPVQLDESGEFWGYDDQGNLLTRQQFEAQVFTYGGPNGGFAGTAGRVPGWGAILGVLVLVIGAFFAREVRMTAAAMTTQIPEGMHTAASEIFEPVAKGATVLAVAAVVIALVWFLSKAKT